MTKKASALVGVWLSILLLVASACVRPAPKTPVAECVKKCSDVASSQCSSAECERGCEFILDRIVERETNQVLACVARGPRRCGDVVWAHCAVHVGVHADGGPPAPPPPSEDE